MGFPRACTFSACSWYGLSGPAIRPSRRAALILLAGAALLARRRRDPGPLPLESAGRPAAGLVLVCVLVGLFVAVGFLFSTLGHPQGFDDALDIWNLHARFLWLGGAHWREPFLAARQQGIVFSGHPDYPLLLPCSIARLWTCDSATGSWATGSGAMVLVAASFTAAVVVLCASGVALARGTNQGLLAAAALAGTKSLVTFGASQYADVPLTAYITASCVLLMLNYAWGGRGAGMLVLAGLCAGCAAWTKNEGLLFVLALLAIHLLVTVRQSGWLHYGRQLLALLAGLLPMLLLVAYYKTALAPPNDLVSGQNAAAVLHRLADLSRYATIAIALVGAYYATTKAVGLVLLVYVPLAGREPRWRRHPGLRFCVGVVLVMLAGYFVAYLLTPQDLGWHLGTSAGRLLLHVWPLAIVAVFLAAAPVASPTWRA